MPTIERRTIEKCVKIGDLFEQLNFHVESPSDETGDSCVSCSDDIEILGEGGYHKIEALRWTKFERIVKLSCSICDNQLLEMLCSPEHIVRLSSGEWVQIQQLKCNDLIVVRTGVAKVVSIQQIEGLQRLCDIQVADVHCYYSNDVLSHNSHWLAMIGANAMKQNINVLHYTLELSEAIVGRRYDSYLCGVDFDDIMSSKQAVLDHYKENKYGRLIIKEFPTGSASIYTMRAHVERLELKGFTPGLIIIDYADIMRSTRKFDSLRHELKLVYEELRGWAGERKVPIWSASQSNKEGANSDIIDLSNMSEAYGKAFVADVIVSVSRRAHEKASGFGRLYIAKSRVGRDGLVFPIRIDTAQSRFEVSGEAGTLQEATKENESDLKKALKAKLKELQDDPTLAIGKKGGDREP